MQCPDVGVSLSALLKALNPNWGGVKPERLPISTPTAMAKHLLSGCTKTSERRCLMPRAARVDAVAALGLSWSICVAYTPRHGRVVVRGRGLTTLYLELQYNGATAGRPA